MKDKKETYPLVRNLAYSWDAGLVKSFTVKNKIKDKYGLDYARQKMSYATNKLDDLVFEPRFYHLTKQTNEVIKKDEPILVKEPLQVYEMQVPENEYEQWLHSVPIKDIKTYEQKKILLDRYLSSFPRNDRDRLIKIMTQNQTGASYISFIDLNPDLMNSQQTLIYKDIIRFYELEAYQDIMKEKQLWEYFNEVNKAYNKETVQNITIDEQKQETTKDEIIKDILNNNLELQQKIDANNKRLAALEEANINTNDNEFLNSNSSIIERLHDDLHNQHEAIEQIIIDNEKLNQEQKELNDSISKTLQTIEINNQKVPLFNANDQQYIDPLINMSHKLDDITKQINQQRKITESILNQQKINNENKTSDINNFYNERIYPLMFTPQTTVANAKNIFGVNNEYAPGKTPKIIERNIILSNPKIPSGVYVTNIADLINQRDYIMKANNQLVNEIINKQIQYNNQFSNSCAAGSINIQVPPTGFNPNGSLSLANKNANASMINNSISSQYNAHTSLFNNSQTQQQAQINAQTPIDENKPIPLSAIRNKQSSNQNLDNMLSNQSSTKFMNIDHVQQQINDNKPKSLSSILGRQLDVNKVNNLSSSNSTTSVSNTSKQNQSTSNELNKKPVQTIRPYKPNLANKISKVVVPTKSFTTSKSNSEPSNENKVKLANTVNQQETIKQQNVIKNEQTVKKESEQKQNLTIPSKKLV